LSFYTALRRQDKFTDPSISSCWWQWRSAVEMWQDRDMVMVLLSYGLYWITSLCWPPKLLKSFSLLSVRDFTKCNFAKVHSLRTLPLCISHQRYQKCYQPSACDSRLQLLVTPNTRLCLQHLT